jgi:hypothetical protein
MAIVDAMSIPNEAIEWGGDVLQGPPNRTVYDVTFRSLRFI